MTFIQLYKILCGTEYRICGVICLNDARYPCACVMNSGLIYTTLESMDQDSVCHASRRARYVCYPLDNWHGIGSEVPRLLQVICIALQVVTCQIEALRDLSYFIQDKSVLLASSVITLGINNQELALDHRR